MKKNMLSIVVFVLAFCTFGTAAAAENGVLVACFSWSGNTMTVAKTVTEVLGAELFEIKTATPYTDNYDAVLDVAKAEQNRKARPELATHVENMAQYNTVFIGYPCWWGTMPMAVFTFLEEYDFSGKRVIPFVTHGGSGFGRSLNDLKRTLPDAKIETKGLSLYGKSVSSAHSQVIQWLDSLGFTVRK